MYRPSVALVLSSTVALAACIGGSNGTQVPGPDQITVPPTVDSPSTALATEPDGSTPLDTDPVDTAASTTTTTTEPAPTTTLGPLEVIALELQRDFEASEVAVLEAFGDPSSPNARLVLAAHFSGETLQRAYSELDSLAANGLSARSNPEIPQVLSVLGTPVFIDGDASRVSARTCRVDAAVVFRPGVDDEPDEILNDTVRRVTAITEFFFEGGVWKLVTGTELTNRVGETTCEGV